MHEVPQKSKAALLIEFNKPLVIKDVPLPKIEQGAVLIRNEMAGICGSDIHVWHGSIAVQMKLRLPIIMGHETIGRIVKITEGRTHDCSGEPLKVGDRILATPTVCGKCYWCLFERKPNLCINKQYFGFGCSEEYPYLLGGFAEYSYIQPMSEVVKVPEDLKNEEVVGVGCALRAVVHAYGKLGGLRQQDNVVILGAGPIGLYSLLLAKEGGAGKTIVIGAPENRLDLAKEWGADHLIDIDEKTDPKERIKEVLELTSGIGADVVIEGAGVPPAFAQGLEMVRSGGRYLVIGQALAGITVPIVPAMIMTKQLTILGSMSSDVSDYYRAIQFIKNKRYKYPLGDIVTNKYSLDRINEAFAAMESGKEIKPVIVP